MSESIYGLDYAVILIYLLMLIGIGFYVYQKDSTYEQYILADRMMTTPMLISTLVSTYYGLDILFGSSELAFNDCLVAFFGYSLASLGFYIFVALYMTKKLRSSNVISLPEILEKNYGKSTAAIGAVGSMIYCLPTTSLFALGRVSEFVFGIDAHYGALILGGIALGYTLLGGLKAVAITDTIQFSLMCITVAIGVPLLLQDIGGFTEIKRVAPEGHFSLFGDMPFFLLLAYISLSLATLIDPSIYLRNFAWLVVAGGMAALVAVANGILPPDVHTNDVFLMSISYALPIGLTGIFLAGVLATAMSTIDGYSLVAGSNISYDMYRPVFNPDASDKDLVRVTKIGVACAWTLGYIVAFQFDRILALLVFVTTVITSTVFVPVMMGLFYKDRKTALAGILSCSTGLASVVAFYIGLAQIGVYNEVYGTFIWSVSIAGFTFDIWQEYALFYCLPISFIGFLIGNQMGRNYKDSMNQAVSA